MSICLNLLTSVQGSVSSVYRTSSVWLGRSITLIQSKMHMHNPWIAHSSAFILLAIAVVIDLKFLKWISDYVFQGPPSNISFADFFRKVVLVTLPIAGCILVQCLMISKLTEPGLDTRILTGCVVLLELAVVVLKSSN